MSRRFRSRLGAAIGVAFLLALVALPVAALAHERRTIGDGKYDVVVGWDVEPAYQGQKNGASIRISEAGSNPAVPVEGAEKSVKVRIRQGATTREFPLRAVFGQKGYYVADLLPTRDGDYQLTFVGTLNGQPINDTFDTADGKFNKVESISGLEFPQAVPDPSQAAATLQAAQAEAQTAREIAMLGVGLAVVALLAVAAIGVRLWPRSAAPALVGSADRVRVVPRGGAS
jgi:hypothetical protein